MPVRLPFVLCAALGVGACAATTPPPRFSATSPADPDAPEGALPPAGPVLTASPAARPTPTATATPAPHHHGGHR